MPSVALNHYDIMAKTEKEDLLDSDDSDDENMRLNLARQNMEDLQKKIESNDKVMKDLRSKCKASLFSEFVEIKKTITKNIEYPF